MADHLYETSVFLNRPFDDRYQPLFRATIFTVLTCGIAPRCALEPAYLTFTDLAFVIKEATR